MFRRNKVFYKLIELNGYLEYHVSLNPMEVKSNSALSSRISLNASQEEIEDFRDKVKQEIKAFNLIEILEE
jgi:hypothetical protein